MIFNIYKNTTLLNYPMAKNTQIVKDQLYRDSLSTPKSIDIACIFNKFTLRLSTLTFPLNIKL